MVEKNVAYNRDNRSEEFADNDPLAQLARLVAQEDRPAHVAPPVGTSPDGRREPEFNLEDELLREFAIYDAPRHEPVALDPANDVRASVPANEFLQRVESVFARKEPELGQTPAEQTVYQPVEQYAPADNEEYLIPAHAAPSNAYSDLRDDFSDDPASVAALFDVNHRGTHQRVDTPVYHEPAAEPVYEEPVAQRAVEQEPVPHYVEPVAEAPQAQMQAASAAPLHQPDWEQMAETSGEAAVDLASELEMSVADVASPVLPTAPPVRRSSLEFSSLRLPLANFGATRPIPTAPRSAATVVDAPAPVEPAPAIAAAPQMEAPISHIEPSIPAGQKLSAMDELIYDVAKYEISNKSVSAAAPVAHLEPVATAAPTAAVAPAIEAAVRPVPQQPVRAEPSFQVQPAAPAPAADDFDAFKDEDFELALDDIDFDIDLSEIANIDVPEPVVNKSAAEPAPAAPILARPATLVAPVAAAPAPKPAPVAPRPQPVAAPVARQEVPRPAAPVVPVSEVSLENLPFDPTQIGETEDAPETITEMEVPELPVGVFEPKPAPRRQEEDLDLDTELAALFAPAASGGLDRHKNAEAKQVAERQPQPTQHEVDEFERALEEDFRRSMQEAAETRASAANSHPENIGQHVRYEDEGRSGGRRWFMPMAAAVGLILVGGGTYALLSGGGSSAGSNGAPVIISADNEPTKVVPDNPGGRVVPNQDKAVYDRVAGGAPSAPVQPALISTNEEPVDVVQRTLIPEQLPLEDEGDQIGGASTPVGETEDPRLLSPEEQHAQNNNGGSGVGVSPRKVRTMIVKPDGTLVAQEVPEPTPAAPQPQADRVEQLAAPQPQSGEGAPAVIATSRVPVAPQPPAQAQPQQAAPAQAATQTAAPMPASRPAPAAQPTTTAANQPNVRPAPPSQPAQETAAAPTPATNASSSGGYYIQIASLPSQADAQKSYQNLSTKFASVIGGRGVDIKAAEIAGKGTFYRVRIPAGDKNEAAALCERFRSAGGSCLIAR